MNRGQFLDAAKEATYGPRDKTYGPAYQSMLNIATLWNAYLRVLGFDVELRPEHVAWMLGDVKQARSAAEPLHEDNYIDGSAYPAIAGEVAFHGREKE